MAMQQHGLKYAMAGTRKVISEGRFKIDLLSKDIEGLLFFSRKRLFNLPPATDTVYGISPLS